MRERIIEGWGCGSGSADLVVRAMEKLAVQPVLKNDVSETEAEPARRRAQIYPYLLRGTVVERVNQVWSTDITYIRMAQGFVYLVAVMDWFSR